MKRIVFCFDGTWNALNADTPTNVVLAAASVLRQTPNDVTQIIHYDEGVGTGRLEKLTGGLLGAGLVSNVREAYRFLIFNYDPGDEIFVFGFSRGAFSARTFIGFVRHVGPLRRLHAARIDEALELYRKRLKGAEGSGKEMRRFRASYASNVCIGAEDDAWRCTNVPGYVSGSAPPLTIRYLGIWDTVSALGVPSLIPLSAFFNRMHAFHDASVTDFVEAARHAAAVDERRALFPPVLAGDLVALNAAKGFAPDDPNAPYQEKWFPGTHGSVGGGGDIRGLSDGALAWVVKGAKLAGLRLDTEAGSRIHGFAPDPLAPLVNVREPKSSLTQLIHVDRAGPADAWQVSASAVRRWNAAPDSLYTKQPYRPSALAKVAKALSVLPVAQYSPGDSGNRIHKVISGDTLSKLAKSYLGDPGKWRSIFEANRDLLDDPDEIFVGQEIRIPEKAAEMREPIEATPPADEAL